MQPFELEEKKSGEKFLAVHCKIDGWIICFDEAGNCRRIQDKDLSEYYKFTRLVSPSTSQRWYSSNKDSFNSKPKEDFKSKMSGFGEKIGEMLK